MQRIAGKTLLMLFNIKKNLFTDNVILISYSSDTYRMGNGLRRNICQKRLSERLDINKICGGFINIRERIQIMMLAECSR